MSLELFFDPFESYILLAKTAFVEKNHAVSDKASARHFARKLSM